MHTASHYRLRAAELRRLASDSANADLGEQLEIPARDYDEIDVAFGRFLGPDGAK
ncbi:MAG: hypothetical protein ACM3JG_15610 [Thiohalocapsa sp.]